MRDLAFYDHGTEPGSAKRKPLVAARRVLRRVLRPMLHRLEQILESVCNRLDADEIELLKQNERLENLAKRQAELADQVRSTMAFGWDYTAMIRRLSALEDRVEALTVAAESPSSIDENRAAALPFPDRDTIPRSEAG